MLNLENSSHRCMEKITEYSRVSQYLILSSLPLVNSEIPSFRLYILLPTI